jgi:hypothetical protein
MGKQLLGYGVVLFALIGLLAALPGALIALPCWWIALQLLDQLEDY